MHIPLLVKSSPIPFLRLIGKLEAISFLLLLGVAMPLKYLAHKPEAVKFAGWIHGLLFITFCVTLLRAWTECKWPVSRAAVIFIAALLPFGPFVVDRRLVHYEAEFQRKSRENDDADGPGEAGGAATTPQGGEAGQA